MTCTCQFDLVNLKVLHCPLHAAAPKLIEAAERLRVSLRHGTRELTGQGAASAAFASRADETAAAFRDLWAVVAEAKGDAK